MNFFSIINWREYLNPVRVLKTATYRVTVEGLPNVLAGTPGLHNDQTQRSADVGSDITLQPKTDSPVYLFSNPLFVLLHTVGAEFESTAMQIWKPFLAGVILYVLYSKIGKLRLDYRRNRARVGRVRWWLEQIRQYVSGAWGHEKSIATLIFLRGWVAYDPVNNRVVPAMVLIMLAEAVTSYRLTSYPLMHIVSLDVYRFYAFCRSVTVLTFGILFWLKQLRADWSFWSDYVVLNPNDLFCLGTALPFLAMSPIDNLIDLLPEPKPTTPTGNGAGGVVQPTGTIAAKPITTVPLRSLPGHATSLTMPQDAGVIRFPAQKPELSELENPEYDSDDDDLLDIHEKDRRLMQRQRTAMLRRAGGSASVGLAQDATAIGEAVRDKVDSRGGRTRLAGAGVVGGLSSARALGLLKQAATAPVPGDLIQWNPSRRKRLHRIFAAPAGHELLDAGVSAELYAHASGKTLADVRKVVGSGPVTQAHLKDLGAKDFPLLLKHRQLTKIGLSLTIVGGVFSLTAGLALNPLGKE